MVINTPAIPTKQVLTAVANICDNEYVNEQIFGSNKEHKISFRAYINKENKSCKEWTYEHYGVMCAEVQFLNAREIIRVKIFPCAFSQTDAVNINSLLVALEVPRVKVYRKKDCIYIQYESEKTDSHEIEFFGQKRFLN